MQLNPMFSARKLQDSDYPKLLGWWKYFRFPSPTKEYLPENGTGGIMVMKDDIDIAAGFIFFTNSKIVWIEFIVSNPEYKEKNRVEAIRFLIDSLGSIAKSKGFKVAFTTVQNENLVNRHIECGYTNGGKKTELVKLL